MLQPFEVRLSGRVLFGPGTVSRLGQVTRDLGARHALLVADAGIVAAGYAHRAAAILGGAGVEVCGFHDFGANPDSRMVEVGRVQAAAAGVDAIVALGGGSSLDCAKGINFVLTNGGSMSDYRGYGKATRPMLPMVGVPTTAGTGSDAQSYALISDAVTHAKMACGDSKAAFRTVILDPELTVSQPRAVTAVAGIDAISHAVESYVTTRRTELSDMFAREAWRLLEPSYERVLMAPDDLEARGAMLLGAYQAGMAVEQSMLGAAHACANPLTARYGTTHGVAIGVMLPHVVRWNAAQVGQRYADLLATSGGVRGPDAGTQLANRLAALVRAGGLPATIGELGVSRMDLEGLAADAATQWTGTCNPRPFDASAALGLYEQAYQV
jgi:alcohol dehydrogenase